MVVQLNTVDRVEILTLQDNTIDMITSDNSEIITRARPIDQNFNVKGPVLAEHGFSCQVSVTKGNTTRHMLFDFGNSAFGAAYNADLLDVDLRRVELLALSHGHFDHIGGLAELMKRTGKKSLDLVLHPAALREGRGRRINDRITVRTQGLSRETLAEIGVNPVETRDPMLLLDGDVLFLGEIPRRNDFEKAETGRVYHDSGKDLADTLPDDTSIVFNVRDRGLVLLSGCAHAGIVNSLTHAVAVTGISTVMTVMGGFHLSGREELISPTIEALKGFQPDYIVPTHCTGRTAINRIEAEMGDQFLLNMSGTTLSFAS